MRTGAKAASVAPRQSRIVWRCLIVAVATLATLALAPAAAFAAKEVVNEFGGKMGGETGGLFEAPSGVAVNQTGAGGVDPGTSYVADTGNRRVQMLSPTGAFISAWGFNVDGSGGLICTVAAACRGGEFAGGEAGSISVPSAIAVDQANGNVFVTENFANRPRVNVYGAKGEFQGAIGWGAITGGGGVTLEFCTVVTECKSNKGFGFPFRGGYLASPLDGLAVDSSHNLYVASGGAARVEVLEPELSGAKVTGVKFLRAFGKDVLVGGDEGFEVCEVSVDCQQGKEGSEAGAFASTSAGAFTSPSSLALDSEDNLFVLDPGNRRVQRIDVSGAPTVTTASFGDAALKSLFGDPPGLLRLAVDPSTELEQRLLISGRRAAAANKVGVAELDHTGASALPPGVLHGADLTITSSSGLAVAKASLGGSLYLSAAAKDVLQGVYALNEEATIEPITTFAGTTALFEGEVVAGGFEVSYRFELSTDGDKWTPLPSETIAAGEEPGRVAVTQEATGLTGSQHYFVRLVQDRPKAGGRLTSKQVEFTTLAAAPAISGTVASSVGDTHATLTAYLDPQNQSTSYRFEYGPGDCSTGSCASLPVKTASGGGLRLIGQTVTGLEPGTVYHYRLIATNATGTTEGPDRAFQALSAGTALPDGRAYELVTPPDTGAVILAGSYFGSSALGGGFNCFDMYPATADGDSVVTMSNGGSLPGLTVNGFWDLYRSVRDPLTGWSTLSESASPLQSTQGEGGLCPSPDHSHSTFLTGAADEGALVIDGDMTSYLRKPSGAYELVGLGEVAGSPVTDPQANARWITAEASHIVFVSKVRLADDAPPSGTQAVYDRSANGPTATVSLLPGEVTPAAGQDASYQGSTPDGTAVAFKLGGAMYVRRGGETREVAAAPNAFAGISRDGERVFYESGGDLFVYDAGSATEIAADSTFVNVSADGSHAYFTSKAALTGAEENAHGQEAEAGKDNIYVWNEQGGVRFVAIVAPLDVASEGIGEESNQGISLTNWVSRAIDPQPNVLKGRADDPSRATPDGRVFVFESRADLTDYESDGRIQIYRFDSARESLECVSCPAPGVAATSDARLQLPATLGIPTSQLVHVQNVTDDGEKVFFQTEDPLVPGDVNETWDVYEWKAGQQAYLISSGKGQLQSLLYGMTPDGSDVFFTSNERLVPQDLSNGTSIYDARVGGGFPAQPPAPPCAGDACQPATSPPTLPAPASASVQGADRQGAKPKPRPRCPKGKRKVRRKGKTRCVSKKQQRQVKKKKRTHRANDNRRAAR